MKFVFFGTDKFSITVLDELEKAGFVSNLLVTVPDRPQGRKMELLPSPAKVWGQDRNIEVLQPEKLSDDFIYDLRSTNYDLFIVTSYGKIIPKSILDIPEHGSLNVHPSLLPRFRGASPIESQILENEKMAGATIILMDEKMDHGPIVAQEIYPPAQAGKPDEWPPKASELENDLAHLGGKLLADIIPDWIAGKIDPQEQEHELATFTKKLGKDDAEIDLNDDPYKNLLQIRAYQKWPRAYFFEKHGNKNRRVIITEAHLEDDQLILDKVIPEGKKEMEWKDYKRNLS